MIGNWRHTVRRTYVRRCVQYEYTVVTRLEQTICAPVVAPCCGSKSLVPNIATEAPFVCVHAIQTSGKSSADDPYEAYDL